MENCLCSLCAHQMPLNHRVQMSISMTRGGVSKIPPRRAGTAQWGVGGGGLPGASSGSSMSPSCVSLHHPSGPPKVRCGPATVLQPRLPSHGLHRLLSSIRVPPATECPMRPFVVLLPIPPGPGLEVWASWAGALPLGHIAPQTPPSGGGEAANTFSSTERVYSRAIAFSNRRCSVPLESSLPMTMLPPLPLAQARPRSQKSGQNGGSTPTPALRQGRACTRGGVCTASSSTRTKPL